MCAGVFQIINQVKQKAESFITKTKKQRRQSPIHHQTYSITPHQTCSGLHQPKEWWKPRGKTLPQVLLAPQPSSGLRLVSRGSSFWVSPWRSCFYSKNCKERFLCIYSGLDLKSTFLNVCVNPSWTAVSEGCCRAGLRLRKEVCNLTGQ